MRSSCPPSVAPLVLLFLSGCGSVTTAHGLGTAASDDASAPVALVDAGLDAPVDADAEAEAEADANAPTDAGADAARADAANACASLPNDPATQSVTIRVTNQAAADRFVVTSGSFCDPFAIETATHAVIGQQLGFQCGCECPAPAAPQPSGLHRLAPAAAMTLTWDARGLVTCERTEDCSSWGPGMQPAPILVGGSERANAGSYQVTIGALATLPAGCSGDGTDYTCSSIPTGPPVGPPPPAIQAACSAPLTATGSFVLADAGNATVDVALTQ